jgi:hypothetical protein
MESDNREVTMSTYEFMASSPWLTLFLGCMCTTIAAWPFRLVNRWIRHRNIIACGWPPAHCDADGDAVMPQD